MKRNWSLAAGVLVFFALASCSEDRTTGPAGQEAFAVVLRAAHECVEAGVAGTHSAEDVALAGWSVVHGLASLQGDGVLGRITQRPLPDVAQALFAILVNGVAPR